MLLRKNESSLENKTISLEDFSSELKFSKKKKSLQDEGSDTKFIKCYYEFRVTSHKYLQMLILVAPILSLTRVIL